MNDVEQTLTRVVSRYLRRAVPIRTTSTLADDPTGVIGIATIKIVTEEQIQAIAFGPIEGVPQVVTRLDPIGRDATDLRPFADFLGDFANDVVASRGVLPRIWVPHAGTLESLDVLGHRYWRNKSAAPEIVRMGEVCRIIAHEASFPGQQVVADAATVLRTHVLTGQTPIEDGHLGALLAWLEPSVSDPLAEARSRIRLPASGVLVNTPDRKDDERVDRLRREAKHRMGSARDAMCEEIHRILRSAVLSEWGLMVRARSAFQALSLPATGLGELVKRSGKRVSSALVQGHFPARRPERLAMQMDDMEAGQQLENHAALESDMSVRRRATRSGGAILGKIVGIQQPRRGFKPCVIRVETLQSVVRSRRDDKVGIVGTNVSGVVRSIAAGRAGGTELQIEITNGVRSSAVIALNKTVEVVDQVHAYARIRELAEAAHRAPWMFYADSASAPPPQASTTQSPLAIAKAQRI